MFKSVFLLFLWEALFKKPLKKSQNFQWKGCLEDYPVIVQTFQPKPILT